MSTGQAGSGSHPILALAADVFSAMIDHGATEISVAPTSGGAWTDPAYAWVELGGHRPGRVVLSTESGTVVRMTRGMLRLGPDVPVTPAESLDAFAELANVLGGKVRSLLPDPGALSLPRVSPTPPQDAIGVLVDDAALDWRGERLDVALWSVSDLAVGLWSASAVG